VNVMAVVNFSNTDVYVRAGNYSGSAIGGIAISSNTGSLVSSIGGWEYVIAGRIVSVTPSNGRVGTRVNITGSQLRGYGARVVSAMFGGVEASIIYESDSLISVVCNEDTSGGLRAVVLTSDSGSIVRYSNQWLYVASAINVVEPSSGQVGTVVRIHGLDLFGGSTGLASVTLAGVRARILQPSYNHFVMVETFASSVRRDRVVLTALSGAVITSATDFEYREGGVISSVTPNSGQFGTRVVVLGERLLGGGMFLSQVTLAGVVSTVLSGNDTVIVLLCPMAQRGAGDIVIVSDTGSRVTANNSWAFITTGTVASVLPSRGQFATIVTISGFSLFGGGSRIASVTLAGVLARIVYNSDSRVIVAADASSVFGQGNVELVSDSGATVVGENQWTYVNPGVIQSALPSSGQFGTHVTIRGERLFGGAESIASVTLVGMNSTILSQNETVIVVSAGEGSSVVGSVGNVTLTANSGALITLPLSWVYNNSGQIATLTPSMGQFGTRVNILGSGLLGLGSQIVRVVIGDAEGRVMSSNNSVVSIVVASHGQLLGTSDIVLTSDSGAIIRGIGLWSALAEASVVSVQPAWGQYGTRVTITGQRLLGGGSALVSVQLCNVSGSIARSSDSEAVFVAGHGPFSLHNCSITFESESGAVNTANERFRFVNEGSISVVEPSYGQVGTRVTIIGRGLLGGSSQIVNVSLCGVEVARIESQNDSIVIVSAADSVAQSACDVQLISDSGSSVTSFASFSYATRGAVLSVTPPIGQWGSFVRINGTSLFGSGSGLHSVFLAGLPSSIIFSSDSSVLVQAPLGSPGQ